MIHFCPLSVPVFALALCTTSFASPTPSGSNATSRSSDVAQLAFWPRMDSGIAWAEQHYEGLDPIVKRIDLEAEGNGAITFDDFVQTQITIMYQNSSVQQAYNSRIKYTPSQSWISEWDEQFDWTRSVRTRPQSLSSIGFFAPGIRASFDPKTIMAAIRTERGSHVIPKIQAGPFLSAEIMAGVYAAERIYPSFTLYTEDGIIFYNIHSGTTSYIDSTGGLQTAPNATTSSSSLSDQSLIKNPISTSKIIQTS